MKEAHRLQLKKSTNFYKLKSLHFEETLVNENNFAMKVKQNYLIQIKLLITIPFFYYSVPIA